MTDVRVWHRDGPPEAHWRLPAPAAGDAGSQALIGWHLTPAPIDGGMPAAVIDAVAASLATVAGVVALTGRRETHEASGWQATADGDRLRQEPAGLLSRARAALPGSSPTPALLWTRRAERIARLFDDPAQPWWLQAQVLLLAPPGEPPPLTPAEVGALLETDAARHDARLREAGIHAILRPAVDGDAIGLRSLQGDLAERWLAALRHAVEARGGVWSDREDPPVDEGR